MPCRRDRNLADLQPHVTVKSLPESVARRLLAPPDHSWSCKHSSKGLWPAFLSEGLGLDGQGSQTLKNGRERQPKAARNLARGDPRPACRNVRLGELRE